MAKVLRWSGDGDFPAGVVGESHYQKDLKRLAGGERRKQTTARLICESNNEYDPKAVRVEIDGKTVGHLSREDARAHRKKLAALSQAGAIVEVPAVIVTGSEGVCGVYLDLPFDEDDDEALEDVAAPIVKKASPLRRVLIVLGLLVVTLVCAAAQNAAVGAICLAIVVWLLWQWRRVGGRFA